MANERGVKQTLGDANDKFTAKMLYEVSKSQADRSVVISAFSVMTPLAQLGLASVGESHDEILDNIGMPNDDIVKAAFFTVNSQLKLTKGVTLKMASKIYVTKNYALNQEFAAATRETFNSEIQSIDFKETKKAADEINSWVEDQTNHKIKKLVSPDLLDERTTALLANAIYFKGSWKNLFNQSSTTDRFFHVSKDKTIQIPTMYRNGVYKYGESKELDAQIMVIPYKGDDASFIIVLPNYVGAISELENKLKDPAVLNKAMDSLRFTDIDIYIPKFKIETHTNLKEILIKIGLTKIFNQEKAKLDKLLKDTGKPVYLSSAVQKAFIEINEEGAEAAAANAFIASGCGRPPTPIFKADRSFYYEIKINSLTIFNGIFRG